MRANRLIESVAEHIFSPLAQFDANELVDLFFSSFTPTLYFSENCPVKSGFAKRFEGEKWTTKRSSVCEQWECINGMRISRIKREVCPKKLNCNNPVWVSNSCCRQYCKRDACKAAGCSKHAICQILFNEVQCKCKKGYRGDGRQCVDINECETYKNCPSPHSCLNSPGSYQCNCAAGFENRHGKCVDLRSCKEDSQCNSNAKCINKVCECLPGYDGDGRICRRKRIFKLAFTVYL